MNDRSESGATKREEWGPIHRPTAQLHNLPLEFRWEATRRHPYYLLFWEEVQKYRRGEVGENRQTLFRYASFLTLGAIGVTGEPVPPETSFEALCSGQVDPSFLSGAVQPLTCRAIATTLLNALPAAELAVLSAIFQMAGVEYARPDDSPLDAKQRAMRKLAEMPSPQFDAYPDAPLVYVHMDASQRTIEDSIKRLVKIWKQRREIPEQRVHTKKMAGYIEVWDLREGWDNGSYNQKHEHQLAEIASSLKLPLSTVVSRYRSAFEMIIGHEFTPELWVRLVAPLKMSELFKDTSAVLSAPMRRRLYSPSPRPVPDTTLNASASNNSTLERNSLVMGDYEFVDLLLDLETLSAEGLTNDEISDRLELDATKIAYIRNQMHEIRNI